MRGEIAADMTRLAQSVKAVHEKHDDMIVEMQKNIKALKLKFDSGVKIAKQETPAISESSTIDKEEIENINQEQAEINNKIQGLVDKVDSLAGVISNSSQPLADLAGRISKNVEKLRTLESQITMMQNRLSSVDTSKISAELIMGEVSSDEASTIKQALVDLCITMDEMLGINDFRKCLQKYIPSIKVEEDALETIDDDEISIQSLLENM